MSAFLHVPAVDVAAADTAIDHLDQHIVRRVATGSQTGLRDLIERVVTIGIEHETFHHGHLSDLDGRSVRQTIAPGEGAVKRQERCHAPVSSQMIIAVSRGDSIN